MSFSKHPAIRRTPQSLDVRLSYNKAQRRYEATWRPLTVKDCVDGVEALVKTKQGEAESPCFYRSGKWWASWSSGYLLTSDIIAIKPLKQ